MNAHPGMPEARRKTCDLLIVGAGPAGMAAAIVAAESGLSVIVADEGGGPGGQIYRHCLDQNAHMASVLGRDYQKGRALATRFAAAQAEHLSRTTVFMLEPQAEGGVLAGLSHAADGTAQLCRARHVLIATGALERPFPIAGWTLPGVMTAGAGQTLMKAGGLVPEGPLVLAGSGPLLMLLAAQYLRAGVSIAAILETTPLANFSGALRSLPGFLFSRYALKGAVLLGEVLRKARVFWGVTGLSALGETRLETVAFRHRGQERRMPARQLLLHQGVVPQVNLAMSAGVAHRWSEQRLAFEPILSAEFATSVEGIFIAGDTGGIGGADAAEASGTLAALAIARRHGKAQPHHLAAEACARRGLSSALRGRDFLDRLYRPAEHFRKPADDVIICRCEEVTAGQIRALARRGVQGPNQAKAFSRAGMGPCQARQCGLSVCELMAEVQGCSPGEAGHMRIRAPVKPVTVAQMAQLGD
jgi:NADPH-dependent 2,4-dienoyl-CoA reductase/sulfur reductase-like enzyme